MILTKAHISSGNVNEFPHFINGHLSSALNAITPISLVTRNFLNLDPILGSYLEFVEPIVLPGDFEIEFDFYSEELKTACIFSNSISSTSVFTGITSEGAFRLRLFTGMFSVDFYLKGVEFFDKKINTAVLTRNGDVTTISFNGHPPHTLGGITNQTVELYSVGKYDNNSYNFDGIISNVKITDLSAAEPTVDFFPVSNLSKGYELEDSAVIGEELVVNGDFSSGDLTGFSTPSDGWSVSSDNATMSETGSYKPLRTDAVLELDAWYIISFYVVSISGAIKGVAQNSSYTSGKSFTVNNTGYYEFIVKGRGFELDIARQSTASCSLDNISIKKLAGNAILANNIDEDDIEKVTLDRVNNRWIGEPLDLTVTEEGTPLGNGFTFPDTLHVKTNDTGAYVNYNFLPSITPYSYLFSYDMDFMSGAYLVVNGNHTVTLDQGTISKSNISIDVPAGGLSVKRGGHAQINEFTLTNISVKRIINIAPQAE